MNDNEKKLQPDNMRELDPEMLEDVTGGGVKEIVAGVTLAAMTMTSGPVSAFGLARAMAEDNGGAIVEAAPIESMEERVWESDAMMEEIVEENYAPAEVIAESFEIEAPVEEVTVFLGGEEEEIFLKEEETEAVFSAEEAAPVVPSFEVGSRKTLKLSEISRALGISSKIENVGVFNEADNAKFALFIDEDGDLAIEFKQSFDTMELGLFTIDDIPSVMLTNAIVEEPPVDKEAPVVDEEAASVKETAAIKETTVDKEDASNEEGVSVEEEPAPIEETDTVIEESVHEDGFAPIEEIADEEITAEETIVEEAAPVEEISPAVEAPFEVTVSAEDGIFEGTDVIDDEPDANTDIDVETLEQIINDTLNAHAGETFENAVAAVFDNLDGGAPRGLIIEALYKVLTERMGDDVAPETLMDYINTGMAIADGTAPVGQATADEAIADEVPVEDEDSDEVEAQEGVDIIEDEDDAVEAIDVDALEQSINDILNAHASEGMDVAVAAVFENLRDSTPRGLVVEALYKVLTERMGEDVAPETIMGYIDAGMAIADGAAPAEQVTEDEEVIAEDDVEAQREALAQVIAKAVEERRTEGIYAALDNSFATLAEYSVQQADPETGTLEVLDGDIVAFTLDAASENFNNSPEQIMGAIGAAAARADDMGYMQALRSDAILVSMAAAEANSFYADAVKYGKTGFDTILETIALSCPELKAIVPLLKALGGDIFSTGGNPNAAVLKKLDAIEAQIQQSEAAIKRDTYNVVSLRSIGDKYSTVADKAELVEDKIGNIMGNSALTDAQKLQQVADLMNNSEFTALESAMNGATKCFTSNVNDIFERQSIFEAAYARACESVMFSGEALKISTPYIARQLAVYLAAYGVMNQVYNAYEQVYGAGSLTATRQKMCERLGGVDLNGNNVGGSVGQQVKAYYGRDRYTFVNRGTANIQLRRGVLACHIVKDQWYDAHYYIDGWIQGIPLNAQQVEALCSYAASRKESLFDYLFNDVGFVPVNSPSVDVERFFPEAHPDQWANVQGSTQSGGLRKKVTSASVTCYDRVNGRWQKPAGRVAVVDGKQTLTSALDHSNRNRYIKCDLMSATDVGVSKSGMESIYVDYDYKNKWIGYRSMDLLIFQGR